MEHTATQGSSLALLHVTQGTLHFSVSKLESVVPAARGHDEAGDAASSQPLAWSSDGKKKNRTKAQECGRSPRRAGRRWWEQEGPQGRQEGSGGPGKATAHAATGTQPGPRQMPVSHVVRSCGSQAVRSPGEPRGDPVMGVSGRQMQVQRMLGGCLPGSAWGRSPRLTSGFVPSPARLLMETSRGDVIRASDASPTEPSSLQDMAGGGQAAPGRNSALGAQAEGSSAPEQVCQEDLSSPLGSLNPPIPASLQHPCGRDSDGPCWSVSLVHRVAGRTGQVCVGQTWHQEPDLGAWKGGERGAVEREVKLRTASCWDPLEPGRRLRSTVTPLRLKGAASGGHLVAARRFRLRGLLSLRSTGVNANALQWLRREGSGLLNSPGPRAGCPQKAPFRAPPCQPRWGQECARSPRPGRPGGSAESAVLSQHPRGFLPQALLTLKAGGTPDVLGTPALGDEGPSRTYRLYALQRTKDQILAFHVCTFLKWLE
uniref:Uncharacterized protein n=1 Tax=Rangifer tarandus platyrhynchus TaxID=3082113 RepID=A0ACB0EUN1_RANTA|nr:unnamed protein product [Rangifer tarandus platyrhynchus]